jgi:hypothetical protein
VGVILAASLGKQFKTKTSYFGMRYVFRKIKKRGKEYTKPGKQIMTNM